MAPELVGRMYDSVILSGDALRSLEDVWRKYVRLSLLYVAAVVRPFKLRAAAETARGAQAASARAARAGVLDDDGHR
jgi:hypothetical protein